MATRSFIMTDKHPQTHPHKRLAGVFVHWDGYPEGVGVTLAQHYTDDDKINRLVDLRDVYSLKPEPLPPKGTRHTPEKPREGVTVRLVRVGEPKVAGPYLLTDEAEALKHAARMRCEYVYIRDESKPHGWRCIDFATDREVELPVP